MKNHKLILLLLWALMAVTFAGVIFIGVSAKLTYSEKYYLEFEAFIQSVFIGFALIIFSAKK